MKQLTPIQKHLFTLQDAKYRQFTSPIIPNISSDTIIGVRIPLLRAYAKELIKDNLANDFIAELPHQYLEEYLLHNIILNQEKDYEKTIFEINRLLPYIDNWSTCDTLTPKIFKRHTQELLPHIDKWLKSKQAFTIRFGIKMLMNFYLDEHFDKKLIEKVVAIRHDEYYVKMMQAWYMATALAKQYSTTIPYLQQVCLDTWTHNKSIQKAIESFRITDEQKTYLRTLKINSK